MESSQLVRAAFAVLVVATIGAFFWTQSKKTDIPVVLRFSAQPRDISPNGDKIRDTARVGFDLSENADVTFSVVNEDGDEVRRIVDDRRLPGDTHQRFRWDGRDDDGNVVPDGTYRMRVVRRDKGRSLNSVKEIRVDTVKPRVRLRPTSPNVVDPGDGKVRVRVSYRGPRNKFPEWRVWRTEGGPVRIVRRFRGSARSGVWDGTVISGDLAVDGNYAFQVRVRDLAGNETLAPSNPPTARTATARTGAAVRRFTLRGPLGTVDAGGLATLEVGPSPRRFQFAVSRLGSTRPIRRDTRRGRRLRVRIPRSAKTGVYLVRVRSRGHRAVWPLAVVGIPRGRQRTRARPLVVLPAITWQGVNEWDSDLDGFGDTLPDAFTFPAERPFQNGRLPRGLTREAAPLLEFLDREKLAYDLTTDIALARRQGPALGGATGVVVAGTARWLPTRVRERLRAVVEREGKTLVSFGDRSLRDSVSLFKGELRAPSPPRSADLFGERTISFTADPSAPLGAEEDALKLFEGADEFFGDFSRFERSEELPTGARLESSAVRDPGEPAFVAYRLGKGIVIRPGTPQWTRQLRESALDVEIPRITRNMWSLVR